LIGPIRPTEDPAGLPYNWIGPMRMTTIPCSIGWQYLVSLDNNTSFHWTTIPPFSLDDNTSVLQQPYKLSKSWIGRKSETLVIQKKERKIFCHSKIIRTFAENSKPKRREYEEAHLAIL
jgi:hypothetical protein